MNTEMLRQLEEKINWVEKKGFGEVVIKIQNGVIHRILVTEDDLIAKLDKT